MADSKPSPVLRAIAALSLLCLSLIIAAIQPYSGSFTKQQIGKYGDWAVVAGASEGLGAEWGHQLAAQNLNVLLIARRAGALKSVADAIRKASPNVEVATLVADLVELTPASIFRDVQNNGTRRIGLVVYNAMYSGAGQFLDVPLAKQKKIIDVNNIGLLELIHPLANAMRADQRGGGLVLMSSVAGLTTVAPFTTYSASKAFINFLSRGLALELAPFNIDVLACVAGATTTPNYLEIRADSHMSIIEQPPALVVSECIAALGKTSSVSTGWLNKVYEFVFTRMLPKSLATWWASEGSRDQIDLGNLQRSPAN